MTQRRKVTTSNFDAKPQTEELPEEVSETPVEAPAEVVVTELEVAEEKTEAKPETPVLLEKPKHYVRPTPPLPQPETSRRPRNVPRY